jgi:hypothetical protein
MVTGVVMQKYSKIGGILTIVAGACSIFYLLMGLMYMLMPQIIASGMMNQPMYRRNSDFPDVAVIIFIIFGAAFCLFALVAGALSITGGVYGIKRKHFGVALAGAIASALLSFPIGIAATVLISMGHTEFSKTETPESPTVIAQETSINSPEVH